MHCPGTNIRCAAGIRAVLSAAFGAAILLATSAQAGAAPRMALARADGPLTPGRPIAPLDLARFVDGAAADALAADHIAGMSVAVVQDGQVVVLKGYGMAHPGVPVDPARTLFRIGSLSKTFTWIALMKEVERGRVKLDAPVNTYLPASLRVPDQGFHQPIRVIDLMSHAAGFEDISLGHLSEARGDRVTPLFTYLARHRPNRVREPGQLASYSNYGAALAGAMLVHLNGQDYETLIEREVIGPLGLADTTFREPYGPRAGLPAPMPAKLSAQLSGGFVWSGSGFRPAPFDYLSQIAPAGAASATAADMARYMRLLLAGGELDGVRIFDDRTASAFRTPILDVPRGVNGWAHGFMVRPMPGGFASYGHGGATTTFFTNMALIPDLGLGVFVTTNTDTGRPFAERLPKLIVQQFYLPSAPTRIAAGDPGLVKVAGRYAGAYVSTRRAYSGLEAFVNLMDGHDAVSVTSAGYLVTKVSGAGQAWVPDGAPGRFRAADGDQQLVFRLDGQGRAMSFPGARGTFTLQRAGLALDPDLFRILAWLVLATAAATWIVALARRGLGIGRTRSQAAATSLTLAAAALWPLAIVTFEAWFSARGVIDGPWPSPVVLTASSAALGAAAASLALLAMTPLCWRRPDAPPVGWSRWRKGGHLLVATIFVAFAGLVALRGGLTPWA